MLLHNTKISIENYKVIARNKCERISIENYKVITRNKYKRIFLENYKLIIFTILIGLD
mgnify:CR=1 FL=1